MRGMNVGGCRALNRDRFQKTRGVVWEVEGVVWGGGGSGGSGERDTGFAGEIYPVVKWESKICYTSMLFPCSLINRALAVKFKINLYTTPIFQRPTSGRALRTKFSSSVTPFCTSKAYLILSRQNRVLSTRTAEWCESSMDNLLSEDCLDS
jgi:hypothetical protein